MKKTKLFFAMAIMVLMTQSIFAQTTVKPNSTDKKAQIEEMKIEKHQELAEKRKARLEAAKKAPGKKAIKTKPAPRRANKGEVVKKKAPGKKTTATRPPAKGQKAKPASTRSTAKVRKGKADMQTKKRVAKRKAPAKLETADQ